MGTYEGDVTLLEPARSPLGLLVLVPLVAALACAWLARPRANGREGSTSEGVAGVDPLRVATLGSLATLVLGVIATAELAALPAERRTLYAFAWNLVRVGSLDASVSFLLGPLGAVLVLTASAVTTLVLGGALASGLSRPVRGRLAMGGSLVLASLALVALGDDLVLVLAGFGGASLGTSLLLLGPARDATTAARAGRLLVLQRAGDAAVVGGIALAFWGLGGSWSAPDLYLPDFRERFVAMAPRAAGTAGAPSAASSAGSELAEAEMLALGRGGLTFVSHPGARVYLGVGDAEQLRATAEPFGVAPFLRKPLPPGAHNVAILPGGGATVAGDGNEVAWIERIDVRIGAETVILPLGPTLTVREMSDQLALRGEEGTRPFAAELPLRPFAGVGVAAAACLLLLLGVAARSLQLPFQGALSASARAKIPAAALALSALAALAGVHLVARLWFLFAASPAVSGVAALLGAATALFAATVACAQHDLRRVHAYAAACHLGLVLAGLALGAHGSALLHVVLFAAVSAASFLVAGAVAQARTGTAEGGFALSAPGGLRARLPGLARVSAASCAATALAPVPLVGVLWSNDAGLLRGLATGVGPVPALPVTLALLLAAVAVAFAGWRAHYLVFEGPAAKASKARPPSAPSSTWVRLASAAAALALLAPLALGYSARRFGGAGEPLLSAWLGPSFRGAVRASSVDSGLEVMLAAAAAVASVVAWRVARARYGALRPTDWAARERAIPGFDRASEGLWLERLHDVRPPSSEAKPEEGAR